MASSPAQPLHEAQPPAREAASTQPSEAASRADLVVYKGDETMADPDQRERRTLGYGGEGDEPEAEVESSERKRIGDFLVRRLIGEGGMGKVYEAEERLSKRRVALKVLRSELARSSSGRKAFVNEMGILASLDNPHVVRCLHCTEVEGELLMALEFLEGETLRERMVREGPLAWDLVVAIAWQVAAGLEAAHGGAQPIIHRDLKPENIMLLDGPADGGGGGVPQVKVMDFGIAKVVQAVTGNTTHSVGTLQYMSPEQIDAQPLTPRSDLYALGLVMWELLAGRPPFESESPRKLLDMLCTEPAPPLPAEARRGLPRGVEQLIQQLLEKDPEGRPADAGEVLDRLEPFRPAEIAAPSKPPARARSRDRDEPPASKGAAAKTDAPELRPRPRLDTVAVVERAAGPRELSTKAAVLTVVGLSLLAGLVTFLIRLLAG